MRYASARRLAAVMSVGWAVLRPPGAMAETAGAPAAAVPGSVSALMSGAGLTAASSTILTLFLMAVLLESALATLFNWRPFVETFNARAMRPLVAFVVAYVFVRGFDYDAITALMDAVQAKTAANATPPGMLGEVLTAAILAGGSAGVNTLMVALGFREVKTPASVAPKVAPQLAWIAVRIVRRDSVGDVRVQIGNPDPAAPDDAGKIPLAGVVGQGSTGTRNALQRFFLSEKGRFPSYGGHEVPAMEPCRIIVTARGKDGTDKVVEPMPKGFVPAPGAIIDLTVTL